MRMIPLTRKRLYGFPVVRLTVQDIRKWAKHRGTLQSLRYHAKKKTTFFAISLDFNCV